VPFFGGSCPFPLRFGGGTPTIKTIATSLAAGLGTAYDTVDPSSLAYVEIQAEARVIAAAWRQNERFANQWDPKRMTDFLPRWEAIFQLPPAPTDTLSKRRARVGVAMARAGYANDGTVYATCMSYLGAAFLGIITTPSSSALVWTPSGWPMGNHPVLATDPDWFSNVAHIVVLTTQPSNMDDETYYATKASVIPALDAILPADVTFDVLRDGPGGWLFRLDDPHNLDNERFNP
jgi:hypothetical protein